MTLDDLDRLWAQWKARVDAAGECLIELRGVPAYEILTGGGAAKLHLTGVTGQRIGPALAALEEAWQDYGVLSSTVQKAAEIRQNLPRFAAAQKIREIESLLTGACVALPDRRTVADRDLINGGAAARTMTLEELLARMNRAFVTGRDGLLEIDASWKRLDAKFAPAVALLAAHPAESAAGLPELRRLVDELRPQALPDPLGAEAVFDAHIAPLLTRARRAIDKLDTQRKNLGDTLAHARQQIEALSVLRQQNEQLAAQCAEKISGGMSAPVLRPGRVAELTDCLARLEANWKQHKSLDRVCTEAEECAAAVKELIAAEERAAAQNQAPLDLRRELRGRISALKAKAVARGISENPELAALAQRADALLHTRPTPIGEAAQLVAQYESRLNGRTPPKREA